MIEELALAKTTSVRTALIQVLSKEWPLTLKQLHSKLSRLGFTVSCQAVFKALNESVQEGLIVKKEKTYCLSQEWIKRVKTFALMLEKQYAVVQELIDEKTARFEFENLYNMYQFILNNLDSGFFHEGNNEIGCAQLNHFWNFFPFAGSKEEFELIKRVASKTPAFIICSKQTLVDQWIAKYYQDLGWKVKLGIPCSENCDVFVHGNTVIQIFFPQEIKNVLKSTFQNLKTVTSLDIKNFYDNAFHKKTKIIVIVIRDKELAMEIYNKTKLHFNNEKTKHFSAKAFASTQFEPKVQKRPFELCSNRECLRKQPSAIAVKNKL